MAGSKNEFVAAQARDGFAVARAGTQAARHLDQQLVAGLVALGVVEQLEVVEVEEQQRAVLVLARRRGHGLA